MMMIMKKEHAKLEKYQGLREQLQRMWPPQAGEVAPADPRNNIRGLCLEECSARNS